MDDSSALKLVWATAAALGLVCGLVGCGGSGSDSPSSAVSGVGNSGSAGGSGSGSGSGSGGGSGGGGSGGGGGGGSGGGSSPPSVTVLFEQPVTSGIAGNFVVPPASHNAPPKGAFTMVLWQPNRFQSNGELVPTTWDAATQTGFTPSNVALAQLGFQNLSGTSTAQIEGETVGAYINSVDLPPSTADQKMMITPEFIFTPGSQPVPFANANVSLNGALDLQIPAAGGKNSYVVADFLFEDPNGVRISLGVKIFRNGGADTIVGTGYDTPSNTYMLNSPLAADQAYVTLAAGSATNTGDTWTGFRHFEWSVSQAQFASALQYLVATYPSVVKLSDPTQYVLAEVHLNAEFHTEGQAAELGWSMQNMKVWTTP